MNLEKNFIKYKDITLTIIEMVKAEEFEKTNEIFQQRQLILDSISEIDHSKEDAKKIYLQYDIDKLDEILNSEMKVKREALLEKIKENKKRQVAMSGYTNVSTKSVFLSKEI